MKTRQAAPVLIGDSEMAQEHNYVVKVGGKDSIEYLIGGGVTTTDISQATKMTEKQAQLTVRIMRGYGHTMVRAAKLA